MDRILIFFIVKLPRSRVFDGKLAAVAANRIAVVSRCPAVGPGAGSGLAA